MRIYTYFLEEMERQFVFMGWPCLVKAIPLIFFEFLQFLKLADLETAVLPFPLIERGSGNIESPADFICRHPSFKFVYALDDFRFGMSQFLHGCSFATKGSILTQAELPFV